MLSSPFKKLVLALLVVATAVAVLLQLIHLRLKAPAAAVPPKVAQSEFRYHYTPPTGGPVTNATGAGEMETETVAPPKITRDQAEEWLAKHRRNASSLLAVFRALGDTNYLNEAATNFPKDPRVELAVLTRDEFPADRRKWLDLFKASSPSNSLANYFSAQDYFKRGQPEAAVQELVEAAAKAQFDSHATETRLDAEELYLESGKTAGEASTFAMGDMAAEDLPQLAKIKELDQGIGALMKEKNAAGEVAGTVELAQLGLVLADRLKTGDSGKYLINQLVGMASTAIMLNPLEPNTAYDFLGGQTPSQVLQQMKQEKTALRQQQASFQAIYPSLTEAELNSYRQRSQIYGELAAKQWVLQQHPPAAGQ